MQDSWKVTRKFTLDYGLRYDYSTYLQGRLRPRPLLLAHHSESRARRNSRRGGLRGQTAPAIAIAISPKTIPGDFGPRLGVAYQIHPKTVFRAGFGIIYAPTESNNNAARRSWLGSSNGVSRTQHRLGRHNTLARHSGRPGIYPAPWPNLNPSQFNPTGNAIPARCRCSWIPNAGRPRGNINGASAFSAKSTNLVVDVSYIGNRGIWWYAPACRNINAINPATLAAKGIDINSPPISSC